MNSNRREFIKHSAMAAAAIGVAPAVLNACSSPAEKVNVALIGCRSMGFSDLQSFLRKDNNVECIALCDVDKNILEAKAAEVEKMTGKRPQTEKDFRKVLDNPDVHAVIIGTPDHWHAIIMMSALEAGKHVYVEKPMGHSIEECNAMAAMQAKYPDLYCQVGMWQRSSKHWFEASEIVKSGLLGDVHLTKAWIYKGYDTPYPVMPDEDKAPDYVDYDMWLGPAPKRPFNMNRFHYNHRWWYDYAGGAMTDWGVHLLDFAMHGMDADMPTSISPGGGLYYHEKGAIETPDIQQAIYAYPKHTMIWECGLNPGIGPYGRAHGVAFVGQKGTLVVSRSGWELMPDKNSKNEPFFEAKKQKAYGDGLDEHVENLLSCIRKGGKLNAPVAVGAKVAIVAEMGNMAYRAEQRLHWDDSTKSFKEDIGNELSKVSYRDNWQLPKV